MNIQLGQILKKLRKQQNLNQQEVANYLFVSRPTYIRYERNLVETPLSKLFALSSLYNFDMVDLVKLIDSCRPIEDLDTMLADIDPDISFRRS